MSQGQGLDTNLYFDRLESLLSEAKSLPNLYQMIVDAPFINKVVTTRMGLGIVVLLLVNKQKKEIDRVALAHNELSQAATDVSAKPFNKIKVPLLDKQNYVSIAIRRNHHMITSDWHYLFTPALTAQEARLNQASAAISCSVIYPLTGFNDGGAMIFSFFEPVGKITRRHHNFMARYVLIVEKALIKLS